MKPMLAKTGDIRVLKREGFIFEPKLDGYRAIAEIGGKTTLTSRNGLDLSGQFRIDFSTVDAGKCILDGEIVAYDAKGNPDFELLRSGGSPVFVAYDILEKDGRDLRQTPLLKRKRILEETVKENETLQKNYYTLDGMRLWGLMKKRRLEGVVAKKADSRYEEGTRSANWLKVKATNTVDCAIMGYTRMKRGISSLALGLYDGGKLYFVGKVASGLSDRLIEELKPKLARLESGGVKEGVIEVKPEYVAEIGYQNLTADHKLRAPVFRRLRDDKTPRECTMEQVKI